MLSTSCRRVCYSRVSVCACLGVWVNVTHLPSLCQTQYISYNKGKNTKHKIHRAEATTASTKTIKALKLQTCCCWCIIWYCKKNNNIFFCNSATACIIYSKNIKRPGVPVLCRMLSSLLSPLILGEHFKLSLIMRNSLFCNFKIRLLSLLNPERIH